MTEYAKKTWEYLVKHGLTEEGTAGLMGNLQAESGIIPNRVEILCLQRLKEHGQIYTDATYTTFVDDGTITRAQFLNPLPGKQYGYGLCQWTSPGRKAGLYDLCKSKGVSIGDLTTQLEWLMTELKTSYQSVYNVLTTTTDIKAASDIVLTKFEQPADTGTSVKNTRYKYGKAIYDEMKGSIKVDKPKSNDEAIKKAIGIAEGEIGYLEKASNKDLYSKTGNPGSGNFTKYWAEVYPAYQGQPWCACFVSWCMMKAFGLETAKKLLKHWPFVYCPTLAGMTSNKTPKVGSVVLFYRGGEYAHTGLVVAITSTSITTIEGNTSGASGVIPNGGGVCKKSYARSSLASQTKYFMPDYSIVTGKALAPASVTTLTKHGIVGTCSVELPQLVQGAVCAEVGTIQRLLNGLGYKGKDGKVLEVDCELGTNTAYAIEQLQRKKSMKNINFGSVAKQTWKYLLECE